MALPTLMPSPRQRFVDNEGLPLVNGMVYTFAAGTSDPLAAFQDAAGLVPHTNPIRLDERGEATIYWLGSYKVNIRSALGVQIPGYPVDNFQSFGSLATDLAAAAAATVGADLTAYKAQIASDSGAGLVGVSTGEKLQTTLSRNPARFGRSSAADLVRFMAMLRAYRNDLQTVIPIVGFGSSVGLGATLVNPTVDAPVAWFKSQLKNRLDPGNIYNLVAYNYSVNGSSASEFPTAYATMVAAGITQPGIAVLCYGMNDQQPALYNSGQTFDGFYRGMRDAITTLKKAGWDVVVMTSPHASIVKNPSLNAMPPSVPQIYPTSIAAPVSPEQMQPPASVSNITAEFIGEGTAITVSHRALRVNQAMRNVCREFGATLIDTERYWFEALQKFQLQTGSAANAEGVLFNTGETVHPNLVGHQNSYQASINDFVKSLAWQAAQPNVAPRMNGYIGYNLGDVLPTAVQEVRTPYPDLVAPPVKVWARTGLVDSNGIRTEEVAMQIDPATGDVVLGDQVASKGSWRIGLTRSTDHLETDHVYQIARGYGFTFNNILEGAPNIQVAAPYVTRTAFPINSSGDLMIRGENTGIGTSPQVNWYRWSTNGATVTLAANGTGIGSAVFTVAVSGLFLTITATTNNTNFQVRWESLGL